MIAPYYTPREKREMLPTCRYRRNMFATPDVLAPLEASPDAEATDVHGEPLVLHPDCFG